MVRGMARKKDYYELLGLQKTATEKEIKAAYRKLARKHHPDVNPGDRAAAEERFKKIAEAFAVLSDPDKRATYDQGGHDAFGPGFDPFGGRGGDAGGFGGFGDLSDLFEMFNSRSSRRASRGADLEAQVRVGFVESIQGTTLELTLPREKTCGVCGGSGQAPGARDADCPDCGGTGRRTQRRKGMEVSLTCSRCQGSGRLPGATCSACGGSGRIAGSERVKVRIPPGVEDGSRLRIPGQGGAGSRGGSPGDLYLTVHVEPHPMFRREGHDLLVEVPIGLATAALGGTVEVPTLDGKTTVSIPAGTRSGQRLRLKGKGVPGAGPRDAGHLYAHVQIVPPKKLDTRSRELLEEFARLNPGAGL